jgi:uncharacterized protein (DUF2252 family)
LESVKRTRTVPRSTFGAWKPAKDRDALGVLAAQERSRLPELLPIRHARMRISPFNFYRGAAAVMAADFAGLQLTGLRVQTCGDAHLMNFGAFASPERNVVFDVNDFDETLNGPWEWDVLRLATSVVLVARGNAFGKGRTNDAVLATLAGYREAMARFAGASPLSVWYDHIELADLNDPSPPGDEHVPRLTQDERPTFVDAPPTFRRIPLDRPESQIAKDVLTGYRETLPAHVRVLLDRFALHDIALKVVGVGSVGTRCYVALLLTERGEPLVLQLKEADASVLEPLAGASPYPQHGQRVVEGQHLVQAASDIFLGWTANAGISYYVRRLHDMKSSVAVNRLGPRELVRYARSCAWTLAHAHARSGSPQDLAAYLGRSDTFDLSAAAFAATYADVTEADYGLFCRSIPS